MTIPFLDFFKKLTSRPAPDTAEQKPTCAPVRVAKKPASERLSKTVLPHATRSFAPPDPFRSASSAPPLELGARRITASPKRSQSSYLPPALARALEPKLERTISLKIADFIEGVPAGYIKPAEILDASACVSLKASEIEKGMADKNPSISLPSLYQQVPEIFLRGVRPDDQTRVALPYEKVLEQFQSVHVRSDQLRDPPIPQLDTPILKATIQDSERFGTKLEPLETSAALSRVPVKMATAESIAAAEPDAMVQEKPRSTAPGPRVISLYSPELKSKNEPPAPSSPPDESVSPRRPNRTDLKTPLEILPNGTGASASERVPASSGPPVPTPLPFSPALPKIPFEPPVEKPTGTKKLEELLRSKPGAASTPAKDPITLSLKAVLQNLPAFQLNGDVGTVSNEERLTLPLALIEPQLASGRISIAPDVFEAALTEKHRGLFQADEVKTPVALPLEEVLKNYPATILKLRDDPEDVALDTDFKTPFSAKAKEDARRFATDKAPAEKKVDPKEVVAQVSALPGVKACAITFSDGLSLAGELPEEIAVDGLSAMAPALVERIAQHVRETKIGS